jgi:hypothetical protein
MMDAKTILAYLALVLSALGVVFGGMSMLVLLYLRVWTNATLAASFTFFCVNGFLYAKKYLSI